MANSTFNLSDINGTNGFVIKQVDLSGTSVSSAGDINGDGIDDLIIGLPYASANGVKSGQSYVVFGSKGGFGASLNLSTLNGTNGFAINGINLGDKSGWSVSSAGDINGDGIDDLIIGAPFASLNGTLSGQSYVVFGSKGGFGASLNLSTLNGTNGFVINGFNADEGLTYSFGYSVSDAGDINGDGIDDLIIGAFTASPNGEASGQSYVVFGSKGSFDASFDLSTLNGTNGFVINGINPVDLSGRSVSSAGDINGDGIDDLIIGAPEADPNGTNSGQSYVVFGSKGGFGASLNLSTLNGTNGFAINGINTGNYSGWSVSSGGDINGDGLDDLIIGAYHATPNGFDSGQSYVVFGSKGGFGASLNLSTLNGTNGFAINGINIYDESGWSVSSAGDINGDGIDDLIIGAYNRYLADKVSGQSYLVFGSKDGFAASFELSTLNGTNGFAINGINPGDRLGSNVSSAGDINADGFDDLILGTVGYNKSKQSYVVFGGKNIGSGSTPILTGTAGTDTLVGTIANNIIDGKAGNDTLIGNGGQDKFIIRRGDGNDIITDFSGVAKGSNPSATVIANVDTLQFTGNGLTARNLQLTQHGNNLEVTFENVANTKVTLQNFKLENLDNMPATSSRPALGNILFDSQSSITDSFDVINPNSNQISIFNKNTVTFLNDLNNNIAGFDNSNDVINGQGGNDIINGLNGNDLLRGGSGNDSLIGAAGNDILLGGAGADRFLYNTNTAFKDSAIGVDTISDFNSSEGDKILLDKTTFNAITSAAGTGFNKKSDFLITNSPGTSTAKIVYDAMSGQLFYNQNGSAAGFGSGGLFVTLIGAPTLTASDFVLQA
ncbi:beta strand repeat-containing protein [Nostoc sp. LEGE 12450]|uniref:beta strand repeat-containing protein n=1 Tax=Nostoc sp. LEGE 12450 TaxID=1828643 RepID=UPI001882CBFF|nr:FG-GAP repeat protein [Nostoc sp. LEGE 12450]MBE8991040.1 FG-GAP repeat protein [Nostoc sp. LEGE 12450]